MPYTPTVWVDNVTDVDAANLNHLENGLAAAAAVGDQALPLAVAALPTFNVKNYGVTGLGLDESTAFSAADTACAAAGGILFIPPGLTVKVQGIQLKSKVVWGAGATIALVAAAGTPQIFNGGSAFTNGGMRVEGLTLDCGSQTNAIAIFLPNNALEVSIKGCTILNAPGGAVQSNGAVTSIEIDGNRIENSRGILFNNNSIANYLRVTRNEIKNSTIGDAINVNVPTGSGSKIVIEGNICDNFQSPVGAGFGICVAAASSGGTNLLNISINGNVVTNCSNDGIHVEQEAQGVTIGTNQVDACGGCGILVVNTATVNPAHVVTITGNTVSNCLTNLLLHTSHGGGIQIDGSTAPREISIVGNTVWQNGGVTNSSVISGILVTIACNGTITGNTCADQESSAPGTAFGITVAGGMVVTGNRCFNVVGTQGYGFQLAAGTGSATIGVNDFSGNVLADILWTSGSASGMSRLYGTGSPVGAIPAQIGATYQNLSGGAGTTLYVKESGAGTNTGWIGK